MEANEYGVAGVDCGADDEDAARGVAVEDSWVFETKRVCDEESHASAWGAALGCCVGGVLAARPFLGALLLVDGVDNVGLSAHEYVAVVTLLTEVEGAEAGVVDATCVVKAIAYCSGESRLVGLKVKATE